MELQNKFIGVCGRKGTGKSVTTRRILQRQGRIFVADQMFEHTWVPQHNTFDNLDDVEQFFDWADAQRYCCGSFIPQGDLKQEMDELCEIVYARGNVTFGIEEVASLCGASFLPSALSKITRLGRHRSLSVVYTTQRAGEISRALTAATDIFVLFHCAEPRDLDAIAARCGNRIAEKVAELQLHDCVIFDVVARTEISFENLCEQMDRLENPRLSKVVPQDPQNG
jgi:hypothetical protein